MSVEEKEVAALQRLGLTEYESKIYLVLVRKGSIKASEVSFFGQVPRTKTYGAIKELERKGLLHVINDILDFSKSGFDLIVMGACGEHEKDACILGSVTKKIIRHTTCPTLVAKQVSSLSNMLVCTDGSEHALKALDFAAKLAEKMDSKIVLLHVQEEKLHKVSPKTAEDLGQKILAKTVRILGKRKAKIDRRLEFGVPANVIVDVAEKGNHDLIVLGRRGLGTIDRFLLGSVSDDVSHKAKCSVLIVSAKT